MSVTVTRVKPTKMGQAWVNYLPGRSEGPGGKGLFYTTNGPDGWSHDAVYTLNPALEQIVGTRDAPTCHIFDCIQGTIGDDGPGGEATRLRQVKYGLNKAQCHLNLIYDVHTQKTLVSSPAGRPWLLGMC